VRPIAIDSLKERQAADYPEIALREFVLNAIIHRDYQSNAPVRVNWFDDRVEIQNPGGTYGQVSRHNLTQRSDYRNPVVAEAMKNLGYVNKFGYGIQRATLALLANGNPLPEFDIDDSGFLVIVRRGV
jgi:ATP-dependent DNA helicase RecG